MESWKKVSVLLCIFGVLKEFRPSEPYVTKYLNNPPMNFTLEQISDEFYPVSIYTAMVSLVLVFLLTDFLRYKPVIIFDGLCAIVVYLLLIFGRSAFLVKVLEFFYGLFSACDVAYYAYIYAKVDKCHYQEVSGFTRAAYLIGRSVSGVVSQLYVFLYPSDYLTLNYLTLGGMITATIWALFLPSVRYSIYFNRDKLKPITDNLTCETLTPKNRLSHFKKSISFMLTDFNCAASNFYTLKWIFWWSLATAGYYQVLSYTQVLWEQILTDSNSDPMKNTTMSELNGAVETTYTLLSAGMAYGCGVLSAEWDRYGELALFLCSIGLAALLFLMSQTSRILLAFGLYILYAVIYNGMITIANSEIAQNVNEDSHGLIFGFTTFLALIFQSILTTVVSLEVLSLDERMKFVVYSCYFAVLGFVFAIIVTVRKFKFVRYQTTSTDDPNI